MNKKILVASLFATLMLLVSFNSVIGVSDVEEDCGCEVVNRSNQASSIICDILETILNNVMEMIEKYIEKYEDASEAGKTRLASLYYILVILCFHSVEYIFFMLEKFGCWGPP